MKFRYLFLFILVGLICGVIGWSFGRGNSTQHATSGIQKAGTVYQCAMHPWIKSDKPGHCTICGMKLTPVSDAQGQNAISSDLVTLGSNSVSVMNVQVDEVTRRPLEKRLQVAGKIESDETQNRVISAYMEGRVDKLFIN